MKQAMHRRGIGKRAAKGAGHIQGKTMRFICFAVLWGLTLSAAAQTTPAFRLRDIQLGKPVPEAVIKVASCQPHRRLPMALSCEVKADGQMVVGTPILRLSLQVLGGKVEALEIGFDPAAFDDVNHAFSRRYGKFTCDGINEVDERGRKVNRQFNCLISNQDGAVMISYNHFSDEAPETAEVVLASRIYLQYSEANPEGRAQSDI